MSDKSRQEGAVAPEWSYKIDTADLTTKPKAFHLVADEDERANLARRLNLQALDSLEADIEVRRQNVWMVHVSGHLWARVTQRCVVSLQPVDALVEDHFEAWYADPEQAVSFVRALHEKEKKYGESERPMLEEYEDPEPIIEGRIDLGELVAQYLSLALDPYPHAPGVGPVGEDDTENAPSRDKAENPFAALRELREKADIDEE